MEKEESRHWDDILIRIGLFLFTAIFSFCLFRDGDVKAGVLVFIFGMFFVTIELALRSSPLKKLKFHIFGNGGEALFGQQGKKRGNIDPKELKETFGE